MAEDHSQFSSSYISLLILGVLNVQVGDKVQKGQVICIIEAMKLMNEIEVCFCIEIILAFLSFEMYVAVLSIICPSLSL